MRQALANATPGTHILLQPGIYEANIYIRDLRGTADRPIVIAAADPSRPPIIRGGGTGIQLQDPAYVALRDLIIEGSSDNGLNIDDAYTIDTPAHHVTLSGLVVRNIGTGGNQDGIKLSGVDQFRIERTTIENWGGSGIDMVGCHDGVIETSTLRSGDYSGAHGLEAKGGSRNIVIRDNRFEHAGVRAIQLGGVTDLPHFRLATWEGYEAKDITVEGNVIIGSEAAVAFVSVDGSIVRYNTIYRPKKWVIRILQENVEPGFIPSRNGVFTDNIVAFRSDELESVVNIGPDTAPETFQFARNWWYCLNDPARSRPDLPAPETDGVYGIDPQFVDAEAGDLHLRPGSPASRVGAYAPRG